MMTEPAFETMAVRRLRDLGLEDRQVTEIMAVVR